jgi:hypothetical protein
LWLSDTRTYIYIMYSNQNKYPDKKVLDEINIKVTSKDTDDDYCFDSVFVNWKHKWWDLLSIL